MHRSRAILVARSCEHDRVGIRLERNERAALIVQSLRVALDLADSEFGAHDVHAVIGSCGKISVGAEQIVLRFAVQIVEIVDRAYLAVHGKQQREELGIEHKLHFVRLTVEYGAVIKGVFVEVFERRSLITYRQRVVVAVREFRVEVFSRSVISVQNDAHSRILRYVCGQHAEFYKSPVVTELAVGKIARSRAGVVERTDYVILGNSASVRFLLDIELVLAVYRSGFVIEPYSDIGINAVAGIREHTVVGNGNAVLSVARIGISVSKIFAVRDLRAERVFEEVREPQYRSYVGSVGDVAADRDAFAVGGTVAAEQIVQIGIVRRYLDKLADIFVRLGEIGSEKLLFDIGKQACHRVVYLYFEGYVFEFEVRVRDKHSVELTFDGVGFAVDVAHRAERKSVLIHLVVTVVLRPRIGIVVVDNSGTCTHHGYLRIQCFHFALRQFLYARTLGIVDIEREVALTVLTADDLH